MLTTVQLNDKPRIRAQQIHFHVAPSIKWNRQRHIQLESSSCFRQRLESSKEEFLRGTACAVRAFGAGIRLSRNVNEELGQRGVNTVTNKTAHTGRKFALPQRVDRQWYLWRPTRHGAPGDQYGVSHGFIARTSPVEHPRQHGHVQIRVIVYADLRFAFV